MIMKANDSGIKIDPHNKTKTWFNWVNGGMEFKGISKGDAKLIREHLNAMEVLTKTNPPTLSFARLVTLKDKLRLMTTWFNKLCKKEIPALDGDDFSKIADLLLKGEIRKKDGGVYKCGGKDYLKDFKSFYHWYMKHIKSDVDITFGVKIPKGSKSNFVYFSNEDLQKLIDEAKSDYKMMMLFMFDSGVRSPSELFNVRRKDIRPHESLKDVYWLNVREETSKTFGRKIKLMLCGKMLKRYLGDKEFKDEDFIFKGSPPVINQYLKRLGYKVLKIGKMRKVKLKNGKEEEMISDGLTMYDFRHVSACYWLPRYKNQNALMYRFGWLEAKMIRYYSDFLGMSDTIAQEDLDTSEMSSEMQKQIDGKDKQIALQDEKLNSMQKQIDDMNRMMQRIILEKVRKKKGV